MPRAADRDPVARGPGQSDPEWLESQIDEKIGWVRKAAGDRDDVEMNIWISVASVTDDADGFAEVVAPGFGAQRPSIHNSPRLRRRRGGADRQLDTRADQGVNAAGTATSSRRRARVG